MIQLLVISKSAELAKSLHVTISQPDRFVCRHKPDVDSAVHLLEMPLFGACLLDADLTNIQPIRQIEQLRSRNPKIPLIVLSGKSVPEWEEEAALKGADFILAKPVRGTLLNNLLQKLFPVLPEQQPVPPSAARLARTSADSAPAPRTSLPALEILRDFSRIFSFSLNLRSFTYQFALKLREITGVSRIAIFLEKTQPSFLNPVAGERHSRLECLCSVGIEPELFEYLTLSTDAGIGQTVLKSGRILRNSQNSDSLFPPDPEVLREFSLLGGEIAIPILNRERAVGVAVLGERLTGQPFCDEELELLFHLMEELGMAIKSNLLHDHLLANHNLISSVFSQLTGGCLVVDRELNVLHANPAFLRFFDLEEPVQLSDLPRKLAGFLYESAQAGKIHEPFLHNNASRPEQTLRISIVPFEPASGASGAMISVEDFTPVETARKAELKAANLETVATIAEKFAHEIRNALVPIDTSRQLMPENRENPEFSKTLEQTLTQETRRISRLADQLLYLSAQNTEITESRLITDLLDDAFKKVQPLISPEAELVRDSSLADCRIDCHAPSLTHALFELLLNGFQANPDEPKVSVSGSLGNDSDGNLRLTIQIRDRGTGFPADVAHTAFEPFVTTRNVGVGLGLSVARKILHDHHGELEIRSSSPKTGATISVSLPVSGTN